jgi:hypothetical protein
MNESPIQKNILQIIGQRADVRLFRNNVGVGVCGKIVRRVAEMFVIAGGRVVRFGLKVGSGDLIGWQTVTITTEMVGQKFARFLSVETKSSTGTAKEDQENWRDRVIECGGLACVARCAADVERVLK